MQTIPMLNEFELLGLNENATPEDIQLSFAYLYQIIDLIYPLEKEGDERKERDEELKKLEVAYLSAIKSIRTEVIKSSTSKKQNECNTVSELCEIEKLLNQKKSSSSQHKTYTSNGAEKLCKNSNIKKLSAEKIEYPIFILNRIYHKILDLSELEISITPIISSSYGETLKGELRINPKTSLKIIGKIVRKEEDRIIIRLVTRIAKQWVNDFKS